MLRVGCIREREKEDMCSGMKRLQEATISKLQILESLGCEVSRSVTLPNGMLAWLIIPELG